MSDVSAPPPSPAPADRLSPERLSVLAARAEADWLGWSSDVSPTEIRKLVAAAVSERALRDLLARVRSGLRPDSLLAQAIDAEMACGAVPVTTPPGA